MCHPIGAAAAATLVAGGTAVWLYTGHRVGLNEALGGLLAVEAVVAVAMIMWMVLSMRRAHAPENVLEHEHTHPLHRHKHHDHTHAPVQPVQPVQPESGPQWPAVGYRTWGR
jgi:ABC-type nickel/cobalt efflux system permease component RcnA